MAILDSVRQMVEAYREWEKKETDKQPSVEPMSEAEIDLLANML